MTENTSFNNSHDNASRIPRRILSSLLASISAGVVPRSGAPYIAIGRKDEISAFLSDLEEVSEGGGAMRFLIGRYGSGKSFLMQLVRGYALERDFLTADCDLSPERRLYGSSGSGVATYRELMKNLASKASPDGAALPKILARWINGIKTEVNSKGIGTDDPNFYSEVNRRSAEELRELEYLVGGFDFANVITRYFRAYNDAGDGSDEIMSACLRWLRGEYSTKTEARTALGFSVSVIIDDDNWYDFLKLWAYLSKRCGYRGLVVFIDECVNLYKISHKVSRENNYEKILSMFNDTLQGRAPGLDIIFGGTPQFLEDTRRGLFSYEALRSRLCDSRFSSDQFVNLIGPVIRLRRLSDDELFALIKRAGVLYEAYYGKPIRITEEEQIRFLQICLSRAGANDMITPREMLRDYMALLGILMQNPECTFASVVDKTVTLETEEDKAEKESEAHPAPASQSPRAYTAKDIEF